MRSWAVLSFVLSISFPSFVLAGYISNYNKWQDLSLPQRDAFLMGVVDGQIHALPLSSQWMEVCLAEMRMPAMNLTEMVDRAYQDTANWRRSPAELLIDALRQMCSP